MAAEKMDIVQYFLLPVAELELEIRSEATPRASHHFEIVGEHANLLVTRLLGSSVSLAGSLSPINPVTLPDDDKRAAGIPSDAAFFAFAYPLQDLAEAFDMLMKTVFSSIMRSHEDELLFFMLLGGFCYFDKERKFLQANALSLKPTAVSLWLEGPFTATPGAVAALHDRDRLQPVRTKALRRSGADQFAWVNPQESPGAHPLCDPSSSHIRCLDVTWENGAMVYTTSHGALFYRVTSKPSASSEVAFYERAAGGVEVTVALRSLNNAYNAAASESMFLQQDLDAERVGAFERWLRAYGLLIPAYYGIGCLAYGYLESFGLLDTCYFLTTTATTVGYGDFCPSSVTGRLLTSFYAPLGTIAVMSGLVPAMEWALEKLDLVTAWLVIAMHRLWEIGLQVLNALGCPSLATKLRGHKPSVTAQSKLRRGATAQSLNHNQFRMDLQAVGREKPFSVSEPFAYAHALLAPAMVALIGVASAMIISQRSLTDAIYFSMITMTTVGYGDILPTTAIDKVVAIGFMPLAAASLAASIGRFEKLAEQTRIHYTNFRLKLGDMLRDQAKQEETTTPTLTRERFVLETLIDFDLVEKATVDELCRRFDALTSEQRVEVDGNKKLTVHSLFDDLVKQGRVVDANQIMLSAFEDRASHADKDRRRSMTFNSKVRVDSPPPKLGSAPTRGRSFNPAAMFARLENGTVAVNMATADRGFEEWFEEVWVPSLDASLQPDEASLLPSFRRSLKDLFEHSSANSSSSFTGPVRSSQPVRIGPSCEQPTRMQQGDQPQASRAAQKLEGPEFVVHSSAPTNLNTVAPFELARAESNFGAIAAGVSYERLYDSADDLEPELSLSSPAVPESSAASDATPDATQGGTEDLFSEDNNSALWV